MCVRWIVICKDDIFFDIDDGYSCYFLNRWNIFKIFMEYLF